jgi:phosphatidylserine decarboxylase
MPLLTKYGKDNATIMIIGGLVFIVAGWLLDVFVLSPVLILAGMILLAFSLWFFRDPERILNSKAKDDISYVVSPADGKVVEIEEEIEPHYRKEKSIRISVFLSPLDVHVNRSPVSGTVNFYEYVPGEYLVAYHPKSSELNEHSRVGVDTGKHKVFFKQIVGVLARRIVCETREGNNLSAGEQFGMMKFGSRMDISIPMGSELLIKKGDKVKGAESLLAKMPTDSEINISKNLGGQIGS